MSSFELVTELARANFASLSVPSTVGRASIDATSSNRFHLRWTGLLDAVTVLLGVSFLTIELETSSLDKGVSGFATNSSAFSTDELEILWTVNFVTTVSSSDLTSWAGDLLTGVLSVNILLIESSWASEFVTDTILTDFTRSTLLRSGF